jgi:type II secretory pathway pseudopilin PulG
LIVIATINIMNKTMRSNNRKARAFTLLELFLVIAVIVALGAIIWPNMGVRSQRANLEFGANQLSSLLQLARAGSMSSGTIYRARFNLEKMQTTIENEDDPINSPGTFAPVQAHWTVLRFDRDAISAVIIEFDEWQTELKSEEENVLERDEENGEAVETLLPTLMFYPDGTSDSAKILLGNLTDNFTLTMNGLTGQVAVKHGNFLDSEIKKNEEEIK